MSIKRIKSLQNLQTIVQYERRSIFKQSQKIISSKNSQSSEVKENIARISRRSLMQQDEIQISEIGNNINVIDQGITKKVLEYQYQMLNQLPLQLTVNAENQKFNLKSVESIQMFTNYVKSIENLAFKMFISLKELNLNENLLKKIPDSLINQYLVNLQILKANSNEIETLPYLKYVKIFEINQNPIKEVSIEIFHANVETLEFDWIFYLIQSQSITQFSPDAKVQSQNDISSSKKKVKKLTYTQIIKNYLKKISLKYMGSTYCTFKEIFELRLSNISKKDHEHVISSLLQKAMEEDHKFFIQFLKNYFSHLQYNRMNVYNKYLLEQALKHRNNASLQSLFQPNPWPYLSEKQNPYIDNLLIGIKMQQPKFVKYLLNLEVSGNFLISNKNRIMNALIICFKETTNSDEITQLILHTLYQNQSHQAGKYEINLKRQDFKMSRAIINFCTFIFHHGKYIKYFSFSKRSQYYENSIVHFLMKANNFQLLTIILKASNNRYQIDLFQKSKFGQSPRMIIANEKLCKKILCKYENKYFNKFFYLKNQKKYSKMNKTPALIPIKSPSFLKFFRLRSNNLKNILKIINVDCQFVNHIIKRCNQHEYEENEQKDIFILEKLLQNFPLIQLQMLQKNEPITQHELQIIIKKILQCQVYDKRLFLATKIGQLLSQTNQKSNQRLIIHEKNELQNSLQQKSQQNCDTQLQFEYELFHSTFLLRSQGLMSSSYSNRQKTEGNIQFCSYNIGLFGFKKCE